MTQNNATNIALSFVIAASTLLTGCGGGTAVTTPAETREYQGQALSAISDLHENSIHGPPQIDIQKYHLKIDGLVSTPKEYKYDEFIQSHQSSKKVVKLNCVEGWGVTLLWEGVLVKDLLTEAGTKPEAKIVIFHSQDGFTTSLPVDYFTGNDIIMAYKMNDVTIPAEWGFPFMLVAENKWGYKWAKWITEIELSDNTSYRGYWESRGYSNTGDYPGIYFESPLG